MLQRAVAGREPALEEIAAQFHARRTARLSRDRGFGRFHAQFEDQ